MKHPTMAFIRHEVRKIHGSEDEGRGVKKRDFLVK